MRSSRYLVPFAVVVLLAAVALCVVALPAWLVPDDGLTLPDRLGAENDVRTTMLQTLGGLLALSGVALGAAVTLRQVRANREGHTIGLFTKAIEQLASADMPVRHGGVYALELLAELDPAYKGHAHALLTAFIRRQAPWPARPDKKPGLADDVSGALGVLRRGMVIEPGDWSELEEVDLRGAELVGLSIPRLCLAHSNLEDADLRDANLTGATLEDTILRNADLRGADLTDADLTGADLTGVRADDTTRWPTNFAPPV
jgi:hypothetical protein